MIQNKILSKYEKSEQKTIHASKRRTILGMKKKEKIKRLTKR